jgi:hypothetical protein
MIGENPSVWIAIQQYLLLAVNVIHPGGSQVFIGSVFFQAFKISRAVDQPVQIDENPIRHQLGRDAPACHSDHVTRLGILFQKSDIRFIIV